MRPRTVLVAALVLPLLVLAGCDPAGPPAADAHGGATASAAGGQGFAVRARQVAAAWAGSAREQAWRTGYYPLADPTELPVDFYHSAADRAAFLAGRFTFRVPLPTAPTRETVRFTSGVVLRLPSLAPEKALQEAGLGTCPTASCDSSLTVTAATSTTLRVPTSRGDAIVPAWSFRLAGYRGPLVVPAVRPAAAAFDLTGVRPTGLGKSVLSAGFQSSYADGRTLTLWVPYGRCGRQGGRPVQGEVLETADAVVIGTSVGSGPQPSGQGCSGTEYAGSTMVHLSSPLGDRAVLNVIDGSPLQPKIPVG